MRAKERLSTEKIFHDRQARGRAASFTCADTLRFEDNSYLDHETWIRPALAHLGDVAGLPVLDYGCGHGMAAVVLARRGAHVTAFDLSRDYLAEARRRAAANNVKIEFVQADAERLPFADGCFARIWGNAILHHLEPRRAACELYRVLQPGGIAVFCEPWGANPVLAWARRRLSYPGKERTPDGPPRAAARTNGVGTRVVRCAFVASGAASGAALPLRCTDIVPQALTSRQDAARPPDPFLLWRSGAGIAGT